MSSKQFKEELFEGRKEVFGITIDGPSSMDLDDAIWLERKKKGYRAHISISDVGAVVEAGSRVDLKALENGFTRYLKNGNKPMLPRRLAEGDLSLHEGEKRPTITISVSINDDLEINRPRIRRTFIKSKRKLSYEKAESFMESGEYQFLGDAHRLSRRLFEKRKANGAIVFYDKKKGISTTEEGNLVLLDKSEQFNSHIIIQEFMILANQVVAEYFAKNNIQGIFRNHTARASVPNRKDLLSDLETTMSEGNPERIDTFRKRLSLVLERATYAPTLSGHYALNLPAYMHFTSPIRRFADLVNNRQLVASLIDEEPPYSFEELIAIAEQINGLENGIRDKRAEHFKEKAKNKARKAIESSRLNDLDRKNFFRVIKIAAEEKRLTPEVEKQIYSRLDYGKLQAMDLFTILFESSKENNDWNRIRLRIISWLEKNPNIAPSILVIGSQKLGWSSFQYEIKVDGNTNRKIFSAVASLSIEGIKYSSEPQTASSKKEAEQFSSISLLEIILNMKSRRRFLINIEELRNDFNTPSENFKSILHKICQQEKWTLPTYESSRSGSPHRPIFTVVAEITIDDIAYASAPSIGPNIKHAEQLAAESLIQKLPKQIKRASGPARSINSEVAKPHFITWLQDFYQGKDVPLPEYEYIISANGCFECICTALTPDGTPKAFTAEGANKKAAKRNAAKLAYDELNPFYKMKK